MRLRISLVHYLNAAPLGWFFLHGPKSHQFEVVSASPAQCSEQLARGDVDVGLIPSIEYQRIPGLQLIPGIAVAATNEVRSVLMVQPHDVSQIRTIALDTSSRTSVALLKLLLPARMRIQPEFIPHEPRVEEMLQRCDAALVIGDTALRCKPDQYRIMDLGGAWRAWQDRPFVFAFWACRNRAGNGREIVELFHEARDWGLVRIGEIAEVYARKLNLPAVFLERYLQRNLDHTMGPAHLEGLDRFYRLCFETGLIHNNAALNFIKE